MCSSDIRQARLVHFTYHWDNRSRGHVIYQVIEKYFRGQFSIMLLQKFFPCLQLTQNSTDENTEVAHLDIQCILINRRPRTAETLTGHVNTGTRTRPCRHAPGLIHGHYLVRGPSVRGKGGGSLVLSQPPETQITTQIQNASRREHVSKWKYQDAQVPSERSKEKCDALWACSRVMRSTGKEPAHACKL